MTDGHVCAPVTDEAGQVVGRARVSPDLDADGMRALRELVGAVIRFQEEQDAADPVGAVERARRYEAGQQRIRARNARLRGDAC